MSRSDALYLTDGEIAQKLGVNFDQWQAAARVLEKEGLPGADPLFPRRRYWPACKAFLDRRWGLASASAVGTPALDGEEQWQNANAGRATKRRA